LTAEAVTEAATEAPGPYLTRRETEKWLNMSAETVRRLIRQGELTAFKNGTGKTSPLRITLASIEAFIERHTVGTPINRT
jgi:Helix-turn-helix domain